MKKKLDFFRIKTVCIQFRHQILPEVFWLRAKTEHTDYIKPLIRSHNLNIKCYQCRDNRSSYRIEAEEVSPYK